MRNIQEVKMLLISSAAQDDPLLLELIYKHSLQKKFGDIAFESITVGIALKYYRSFGGLALQHKIRAFQDMKRAGSLSAAGLAFLAKMSDGKRAGGIAKSQADKRLYQGWLEGTLSEAEQRSFANINSGHVRGGSGSGFAYSVVEAYLNAPHNKHLKGEQAAMFSDIVFLLASIQYQYNKTGARPGHVVCVVTIKVPGGELVDVRLESSGDLTISQNQLKLLLFHDTNLRFSRLHARLSTPTKPQNHVVVKFQRTTSGKMSSSSAVWHDEIIFVKYASYIVGKTGGCPYWPAFMETLTLPPASSRAATATNYKLRYALDSKDFNDGSEPEPIVDWSSYLAGSLFSSIAPSSSIGQSAVSQTTPLVVSSSSMSVSEISGSFIRMSSNFDVSTRKEFSLSFTPSVSESADSKSSIIPYRVSDSKGSPQGSPLDSLQHFSSSWCELCDAGNTDEDIGGMAVIVRCPACQANVCGDCIKCYCRGCCSWNCDACAYDPDIPATRIYFCARTSFCREKRSFFKDYSASFNATFAAPVSPSAVKKTTAFQLSLMMGYFA